MIVQAVGNSHKGIVRENNEDKILIVGHQNLFAVADGMGGHNCGEVASSIAIDSIEEYWSVHRNKDANIKDELEEALSYANRKVYEASMENEERRDMGTTVVAGVIENSKLYVANVGDSRCYVFRDENLKQITKDHSYVWELFERGVIEKKSMFGHPMKNIVTRCIGQKNKVKVDLFEEELKKNDLVIFCSDGLTDMLKDEEITNVIIANDDLSTMCQCLIDNANEKGGRDNISVILVRLR